MSLLSQIAPNKGARKNSKRKGRGDASGQGGTAGKGHKGQKARSGGRVRRGFEGGQMPLHRRMGKVGFNNIFRVEFNVVNLAQLNSIDGEATPETMRQACLVRREGPIKVLGNGTLTKKINVKAHQFSESAKLAIEKAGGKVEVIS